jgi:hypothetical protein
MSAFRFVPNILSAAAFFMASTSVAQTAPQANVIENVVAVMAAQSYCGQTVNQQMLEVVLASSGLRPEDLSSGGKYYSEVVRHRSRVRALVSTEEGKASFCRRVGNDLSAMFD